MSGKQHKAAQIHSRPAGSSSFREELGAAPPLITLRAVILGVLTIAATFTYIVQIGQRLRIASFVHSQFPMAAFTPFVLWLFLNLVLKWLWPRQALRRGELLTIWAMTWVVGTIPQLGWMTYWTTFMAAPGYFTMPENPWFQTISDYLPWHVLPDPSPRVINAFWYGLPEGAPLPWDSWLVAMGQWLGVAIAMVVFGFCLFALFQRQWAEVEKLTFPLAQMPLDLTRGFDERRIPDIFRSRLFWIGFGAVFLPMLYNMGTYFVPDLPQVELYWKHYNLPIDPHITRGLWFRVMPLVLAVTYLCPLDISGSLLAFYLLSLPKQWFINRLGFSVGAEGQQIGHEYILHMESYGALVFVGLWSIWLARRHLREVWFKVRTGEGDRREVVHYRLVVAGLVLSAVYVIAWLTHLGMGLPLAIGAFLLTTMVYFITAKLIAATGFAYLFPNWSHLKGGGFFVDLIGTTYLSPRSLVAFQVFTHDTFFGTFRIPAWPALAHILRIFSHQPRWVVVAVFAAFPVGFLVASGNTIALAYDEGASAVIGGGGFQRFVRTTTNLLENPTVPDLEKWGLWLVGFLEATVIAFLRARFHWFSLHPMGLAFQNTFGTWLYWFSLFLVWIAKFTLLRYAGIRAYRAGKPFFYGLALGYAVGVVLSMGVDLIWFPTQGHRVHGW